MCTYFVINQFQIFLYFRSVIAPSIESTTVTPRSRPKGQAVPAPLGLPSSIAPRKRPTTQG